MLVGDNGQTAIELTALVDRAGAFPDFELSTYGLIVRRFNLIKILGDHGKARMADVGERLEAIAGIQDASHCRRQAGG
jgi:hypothetical protein